MIKLKTVPRKTSLMIMFLLMLVALTPCALSFEKIGDQPYELPKKCIPGDNVSESVRDRKPAKIV